MDVIYIALGFIILLLAGDVLVKGAVNLALRLGIPALIVSLTIVSFGTSAPELFISIGSVLEGVPGLALGNVVGSNTANVLLVLGVPALIAGINCQQTDTRRSYVQMLAVSVAFIIACFLGPLMWVHGLVLLGLLAMILWDQACAARDHRRAACAVEDDLEEPEGADPSMPGWRIALYLTLG
ncbi:MAG: sodium:calcium antiporter, partial [Pseudomonadota bacterium]